MSYQRVAETDPIAIAQRESRDDTVCLGFVGLLITIAVFGVLVLDPQVTPIADQAPVSVIVIENTPTTVPEQASGPDPKCSIDSLSIGTSICTGVIQQTVQDDVLFYPNVTIALGDCTVAWDQKALSQYIQFNTAYNIQRSVVLRSVANQTVVDQTSPTRVQVRLTAAATPETYSARAYFSDFDPVYRVNNQPRLCESFYTFTFQHETCDCGTLRTSVFNTTCAC